MSIKQVRDYLGIFFLGLTAILGAYILIFKGTRALPIPPKDAESAFQIVIPTFVAQVSVIFRWISAPPQHDPAESLTLPRWAVLGPPILVLMILFATISTLVMDQGQSLDGGAIFKSVVTFCVSLLGASTVFIVSRIFAGTHQAKSPSDARQ
jgi:hypothetical protein